MYKYDGIVCNDMETAKAINALFKKASINTRAQLKTFVTTGALPGGATISAAVFQRALLIIGVGVTFPGETIDPKDV